MTATGLPANTDAERLVLGSILLDETVYVQVADALSPDDFSLESHRLIFERMAGLHARAEHIDRLTVHGELAKRKEADSVGGLSYLVSLDDGLPHIPNLDSYIRIVQDKATMRRVMFACQATIGRCSLGEEEVDDILVGAQETLRTIADSTSRASQEITSTRELIESVGVDVLLSPRRHGEVRLPWPQLDRALSGLAGGQMLVLLAETSRGKTSLALQVATHVIQQGSAVLVWTMEMSPRALFRRLVTQLSGIPPNERTSQLTFEERDRNRVAVAMLEQNPIYFDRSSRSVGAFCRTVRRLKATTKLGLVIVDYLQLIRATSRDLSRTQQVSENSRNIKMALMDFNLPGIVLSQVDRSSLKNGGKIGLHSAKESGDIENDADVLLWIEAPELSRDQPTAVSIVVGKQREGPAGFSIPMTFVPTSQTFLEVASDDN